MKHSHHTATRQQLLCKRASKLPPQVPSLTQALNGGTSVLSHRVHAPGKACHPRPCSCSVVFGATSGLDVSQGGALDVLPLSANRRGTLLTSCFREGLGRGAPFLCAPCQPWVWVVHCGLETRSSLEGPSPHQHLFRHGHLPQGSGFSLPTVVARLNPGRGHGWGERESLPL